MEKLTKNQIALLKNPLVKDPDYGFFDSMTREIGEFLEFIENGRHRATFMLPSGRHVIKVPLCSTGIQANQQECKFSKIYPKLVARTRMFGQSAIQVALKDAKFLDNREFACSYTPMEQWTIEEQNLYWDMDNVVLADGYCDTNVLQAGRNTKGRLVIFDCNEF